MRPKAAMCSATASGATKSTLITNGKRAALSIHGASRRASAAAVAATTASPASAATISVCTPAPCATARNRRSSP
jgi:hypothetical protein